MYFSMETEESQEGTSRGVSEVVTVVLSISPLISFNNESICEEEEECQIPIPHTN